MKTAAQYTPERPHGWMDDARQHQTPKPESEDEK